MTVSIPHSAMSLLRTRDITLVNAKSHGRWPDMTYLLRPGPIEFTSHRVTLEPQIRVCRWSFTGAARTFAHLAEGALYVAFPKGRAVRVDGLPIEDEVVLLSLGASDCSGSTLEHVECEEVLVSGTALASVLDPFAGSSLAAALTARCAGRMSLMRASAAALALRDGLRATVDTACSDGSASAAGSSPHPQIIDLDPAAHSARILELIAAMLPTQLAAPDLLQTRRGLRRHALAKEAERLIWRRVSGSEPGGLSLDELCTELGTTRRTLQLAFHDHFGTPVGLITRSARLQRVRAELGSGTAPAVSEAALRHGFEHLGRFAGYYRDFFGESPSVTLRDHLRQRPPAA